MSHDQLPPNIVARTWKCAPNVPAGRLLIQIALWHPYMQREREGRLWMAKSREALAEETGLNLTAVDAALKLLEEEDLIVRQTFWVQKKQRILHVRLSDRTVAMIRPGSQKAKVSPEKSGGMGQQVKSLNPENQGADPDLSPENPALVNPEFSGDLYGTLDSSLNEESEDRKGAGPEGPATPEQILFSEEKQEGSVAKIGVEHESTGLNGIGTSKTQSASLMKVPEQLTAQQKTGLKASEVLPALARKPKALPGTELGKLVAVWKQSLFDYHAQAVVPFTNKDAGEMKTFAADCPPGHVEAVIRHVVRRWDDFVYEAQKDNGTKWETRKPNLHYMVTLRATAINWSLKCFKEAETAKIAQGKAAEKAAQARKTAETTQTESSVPVKPVQEKKYATVEEAKEIFGDMW
jgi:hypothetical protein